MKGGLQLCWMLFQGEPRRAWGPSPVSAVCRTGCSAASTRAALPLPTDSGTARALGTPALHSQPHSALGPGPALTACPPHLTTSVPVARLLLGTRILKEPVPQLRSGLCTRVHTHTTVCNTRTRTRTRTHGNMHRPASDSQGRAALHFRLPPLPPLVPKPLATRLPTDATAWASGFCFRPLLVPSAPRATCCLGQALPPSLSGTAAFAGGPESTAGHSPPRLPPSLWKRAQGTIKFVLLVPLI